MQVVVFGAGGRTGRQVVGQARDRGLDVTAFIRDPAGASAPPGVVLVGDDAHGPAAATEAICAADAVISAAALATFALDALEREGWVGRVVGVSAG